MKNLFIEVNPIPIKFAMNELMFNVGNLRLPLSSISNKNANVLKKEIKKIM